MFSRFLNVLYVVLVGVAFTGIELMTGGTRLLFSIPAYGLLALAALFSLGDLRRPKPSPSGLCLAASAWFFGYILARTLTSPVAYIAWDDEFMVIGCLLLYLLTACYLTDPRRRMWVLWILLALAGGNLLVGLSQFANGDSYMLFWFVRSEQYLGRASGFYICPDHLAGYLEVVGCLSLSLALWGRVRGWVRLLLGYCALMCLAGLLITGSRGGLLSTCAGLAVMTVLGLGRVRVQSPGTFMRSLGLVVIVAAVAVVTLFAVVLPNSDLLQKRVSTTLDIGSDARPMLWAAAVQQFKLAPVLGTGAATYLYYGRMFRDPRLQNDPIRAHSDYLELLAEYGAVGGLGMLLFLGAHLRWGWRGYRQLSLRFDGPDAQTRGSNAAAWNIGALAAVTCFLVHSAVDFNLHIPANALLLAFVFGVLANPGRPLDPSGSPVARLRPIDFLPRLALPALGLWLAVAGLPKIPGEYFCERARIALRDGHNATVLVEATRGIEHEKENPTLYFYLGQARQNLAGNGPDEPIARSFRLAASEDYRAGLRLAPMDIYLLVHEGEMRTRLGDFEAAGEIFERVKRLDPNSGYADTYYGFYLQSRGLLPEAEAAYQQAAALYPNEAATHNLQELERTRAAGQRSE